ncbi:MAG: efflux RND transporter periplasmic adaptor subunit [Planctomycetaceae bacterium]|nr:efflux RND transporter periplasmic adaptor subunit [Planctomycetaceae bacterium]
MTRSMRGISTRVLVKAGKWVTAAAVVLAVGAGAFYLRPAATQEDTSTGAAAARPVRVVKVETTGLVDRRDFPGVTKELRESKLAFRVPGPLCELDVKVGQRLAEGDVIARIDPRDFELAVIRVEAGLAEAEAGLKAMREGARAEDIAALEAKLGGARSKLNEATLFRDRFEALVQDGSVARAKLDNAAASFDVAQAEVKAVEKELEKAKNGARTEEIEGMEAKIAGLKTQLDAAKNALNDTRLVAPFDGYVSQKYVENYETVAAGHPIVSLLDCSSIDVTAGIPEDVVIQQDRFRSFACELDAYPERWFPAELKEIGPAIQHGKLTYPITVTLKLPADLIVRPGMTARVRIEIGQSSQAIGFRLPAAATVLGEDGKPGVWVVDPKDGAVHRQPVTVGELTNEGVEITGGLVPGQWVVTAGAPLLHEGQRVRMEVPQEGAADRAVSEGDAS